MGRHNPTTAQRSTGPAGVRLRALLSLGMVAGLGAVGTLAAWTDDAKATATFSAGKLDLVLNGDVDDAVDLTSLTMTNMHPGTSKDAALTVANAGTLPFTYNLKATAADNAGNTSSLSAALTVAVYPGGLAADGLTCAGSTPLATFAFNGADVLNPARQLAPAGTESLCVRVSLPTSAANSLQGTGTTATFTFTASQAS